MKRPAVIALLVLCLCTAPAFAYQDIQCGYEFVGIAWVGGWPYIIVAYTCYAISDVGGTTPVDPCCTGGGGSTGGGSGTGGGTPPPERPTLSINYVSDASPHTVIAGVTYSANTTEMHLKRNGVLQRSFAPTTIVTLGSLDDMWQNFHQLTIEACNAAGCAEGGVQISRNETWQRSYGDAHLMYIDAAPSPVGGWTYQPGYAFYTRIAEVNFKTTEYDIWTSGERNGRTFHIQARDGLLWNQYSTRPPNWDDVYEIVPWYFGYEEQRLANGSCFMPHNYAYSSIRCIWPVEYASEHHQWGTFDAKFLQNGTAWWEPVSVLSGTRLEVHP